MVGTTARDVIVGKGGGDRVYGRDGNDLVCGGPGPDELFLGRGGDRAESGRGNDRIEGGDGSDSINGEGGTDLLDGGDGTDTCKRGEHVLECEPVVFDWATAEWDGSHKGQPLDLTGYKRTFDDDFDSLIDHHGRRHRGGALVRAGATGYVPGSLPQPVADAR